MVHSGPSVITDRESEHAGNEEDPTSFFPEGSESHPFLHASQSSSAFIDGECGMSGLRKEEVRFSQESFQSPGATGGTSTLLEAHRARVDDKPIVAMLSESGTMVNISTPLSTSETATSKESVTSKGAESDIDRLDSFKGDSHEEEQRQGALNEDLEEPLANELISKESRSVFDDFDFMNCEASSFKYFDDTEVITTLENAATVPEKTLVPSKTSNEAPVINQNSPVLADEVTTETVRRILPKRSMAVINYSQNTKRSRNSQEVHVNTKGPEDKVRVPQPTSSTSHKEEKRVTANRNKVGIVSI